VHLRIDASADAYAFAFQSGSRPWRELARGATRYLSSEVAGGFTGVFFGLYATGHGQPSAAPADFDWFDYETV
jgi:alpha-N-arabinofuranosidase